MTPRKGAEPCGCDSVTALSTSRTRRIVRGLWLGGTWLLIVLALACSRPPAAPPPQQLRIATGSRSGLFNPMGRALAEIYNARLPNVTATAVETMGSLANVRAVEEGLAEIAFTQADIAYSAFTRGTQDLPRPHLRLRAMAKLYRSAVQIVVRDDSRFRHPRDLTSGARLGAPDSAAEFAAAGLILRAYGLEDQIVEGRPGSSEITELLKRRELDAGILISRYPLPSLVRLNQTDRIRLLGLDPSVIAELRAEHPFVQRAVIPAGTYDGQREPVMTVTVDSLLVCRSDLSDDLVSQLTRLLIEAAPQLTEIITGAAVDADDAFAAPIPLHQGATRYYRERELFR